MKETQTQIDSKIENLLELYPDLCINYADFDRQIKDISNINFEDMWDDMYWTEDSYSKKELAFTHAPSKAEGLAVKFDAGINKISSSYNYQHYATGAVAAFDGGSNIFTSVLAAFGSFPKSMVEETLGFKSFQDELKAKGWNDDEILGNKSLLKSFNLSNFFLINVLAIIIFLVLYIF